MALKNRIDGSVINLCHARGMASEAAVDMLFAISRIHLEKSRKFNWHPANPCQEISIAKLLPDNPLFQIARRRIMRMENAIERVRNGEDHGLIRKQWRKDRSDSHTIIQTFAHVISRPSPETDEDKIADARLLLVRTGELEDYRYTKSAPPTYQGKMSLSISSDTEMRVEKSVTNSVEVSSRSTGSMTILMLADIPKTTAMAIEKLCEQNAEASQIFDWDALRGPMPAKLVDCHWMERWAPGGSERLFEVGLDTGYVERNYDNGIITEIPPGRIRAWAA